jgi:hypothetical protein
MNSILKPKSVIFIVLALYAITLLFLLYLFYNDKKNDLNDYNTINQKQITNLYESNLKYINEAFYADIENNDNKTEKITKLREWLKLEYDSLKISDFS